MIHVSANDPDVFVIGAGPVGMTVAAELTRHGVRCRIVDKRPHIVEHSHASVVHVRTQEVFAAMGIVDGWITNGFPFKQVVMNAFGKHIGILHLSGVDSPYPEPRTIGQNITEQLLIEHLAYMGVTVERPVEAIAFQQDSHGVNVTLQYPDGRSEIACASWLISCEGSGSVVRKQLDIPFEGERYLGQEFVQTDARIRWSYPTGSGYTFINKDKFVGFFPFSDDGFYRILCARPDVDAANREPPTLEEMQQIVRSVADPDAELYEPKWLNRFRTQHRVATKFREGLAFLAGDAGHVHVPVAGQGMNTGIQDAFNLAWKLAAVINGTAKSELLDSYNSERHPVASALIKGTDQGFHALVEPNEFMAFMMKVFAPLAINLEQVQNRLRTIVAEIGIAYHNSPIVEDHNIGSVVAAGTRAPDAVIVRKKDKRTINLFEVFQGTRWTLLLLGGLKTTSETTERLQQIINAVSDKYAQVINTYLVLVDDTFAQLPSSNVSILMDRNHHLHDKYGAVEACIYLVRPDWYVGFRGSLAHNNDLKNYLEKIFAV